MGEFSSHYVGEIERGEIQKKCKRAEKRKNPRIGACVRVTEFRNEEGRGEGMRDRRRSLSRS